MVFWWGGVQSAATAVVDGVRAYKNGDYQMAMEEWLPYAAMGDANALFNLGQMYRLGKGVPVDYEMAEYYYERAAEKGHTGAQGNLGTLYYFGKGPIHKDAKLAFDWWQKAARSGDARSQYMLGILYHNGEAVEQRTLTGYGWIWHAAQQGLPEAIAAEKKLADYLDMSEQQRGRDEVRGLVDYSNSLVQKRELTATHNADAPAEDMMLRDDMSRAKQENMDQPAPSEASASDASDKDMVERRRLVQASAVPGRYLLQLASYRTEEMAQKNWARLLQASPEVFFGLTAYVQRADLGVEKGVYYRLQLGPFKERREAKLRCADLTEHGHSCFVVKAR